jgi:hypothetical protein
MYINIQGASKKFGEWYQKTTKKEDPNKLTILAFKIIPYHSQHTVGNVHQSFWKLSGKASLGVDRRTL